MYCPECGHPLERAEIKFCPNCGKRVIPPAAPETVVAPPLSAQNGPQEPVAAPAAEPAAPAEKPVTHSKLCTAALLLGAGAFVFAVLTAAARVMALDLRLLGALATGAFFLAPLACCFGVAGIVVRIANRHKRGLPSAIAGLLLGLLSGGAASYLLLARVLGL